MLDIQSRLHSMASSLSRATGTQMVSHLWQSSIRSTAARMLSQLAVGASKSSAHSLAKIEQHAESTITVCSRCFGNDAVIADLNSLAPLVGVRVQFGGCLRRCGAGPNCVVSIVERPTSREQAMQQLFGLVRSQNASRTVVVSNLRTFDRVLSLLHQAAGGEQVEIPAPLLRRTSLLSNALRLIKLGARRGLIDEMTAARDLLSEAISMELQQISERAAGELDDGGRLHELWLLRAEVLANRALGSFDSALSDCDAVIADEPTNLRAHMLRAEILTSAGRADECVLVYQRILANLSAKHDGDLDPESHRIKLRIERAISRLEKIENLDKKQESQSSK